MIRFKCSANHHHQHHNHHHHHHHHRVWMFQKETLRWQKWKKSQTYTHLSTGRFTAKHLGKGVTKWEQSSGEAVSTLGLFSSHFEAV